MFQGLDLFADEAVDPVQFRLKVRIGFEIPGHVVLLKI